ncbi:uncharacterized protein LOC142973489 [Anticarsia gemmatalis]|uniref:uncharacterized protein LOC142973489 n=1 Tax=Anticarsia gemmatalis TaxID=129554 RepID=UPI003F764289
MFVGIRFVFIALCSFQLSIAAVTKKDDDYTKIVFPGPIQDLSTRYGTPNKTDPCAGLTYCTVKPDDYPQELFNKMFEGKYKEPIYQPTYIMTDDRQGDPDEVDNCEVTVTYEPLYKVSNKQGVWRTVVQAPEKNFLQMVRLETCNEIGSSCFEPFQAPVDLQTSCKQTYGVWEFLVHAEDGSSEPAKFKADLPICCSCHYKPIKRE